MGRVPEIELPSRLKIDSFESRPSSVGSLWVARDGTESVSTSSMVQWRGVDADGAMEWLCAGWPCKMLMCRDTYIWFEVRCRLWYASRAVWPAVLAVLRASHVPESLLCERSNIAMRESNDSDGGRVPSSPRHGNSIREIRHSLQFGPSISSRQWQWQPRPEKCVLELHGSPTASSARIGWQA